MFLTVFYQMLSLAVLIILGAWLYRSGRLDNDTTVKLSSLVTHIFNPFLMLNSAVASLGSVDRGSWFKLFGFVCLIFVILILLSYPSVRLFEKRKGQRELFQLMLIFGNLGFMGIPVVSGVYGEEYSVYVLTFLIGFNIFFYTYGLLILNGKFEVKALKGMVNAGSIGCIVALVLVIWQPVLPTFISSPISYLGSVCSPLAMLLVGVSVARSDLKKIFTNPKMYLFTLIRLVIIPLLFLPVLKLTGMDPILQGICLIEISMPVANLVLAVGLEKEFDCTDCSTSIVMTTLFSVITLPLLTLLL